MNWWTDDGVDNLVAWIEARRDCALEPGLNELELARAERTFEVAIPPLWRAALAQVHPVALPQRRGGAGAAPWTPWPDWRLRDFGGTELMIDAPVHGLLRDVEAGFWWEPWGPRPASASARTQAARAHVASAARLTPLCGNWYAAGDDEPVLEIARGEVRPVFASLREFAGADPSPASAGAPVPFWSARSREFSEESVRRAHQKL